VVGKDCFDKKTFEIDLTVALPSYSDGDLVEGRNAKALGELMRAPEVERAGLLLAEVVALRLYTGPMYCKYNQVLRDSLSTGRRGRASGLKWEAVGATKPADGEELTLPRPQPSPARPSLCPTNGPRLACATCACTLCGSG
jgi:hypothetical protein